MTKIQPKNMKRNSRILLTLLGSAAFMPVFAQGEETSFFGSLSNLDSGQLAMLVILMVVLGLVFLLLLLLIYLMSFLTSVLEADSLKKGISVPRVSLWEQFKRRHVTGEVETASSPKGKVLEDHSYDGIVELDNFMPPWLQYVFVLSIGFGILYFINFSVLGWGPTQEEEYQAELVLAQAVEEERKLTAVSTIDEFNVVFDKTTESINAGEAIYNTNCVACHASDGGGGVGPNLTDEYWIHGGAIGDVFAVVKYGVPDKGMIPWQDQLSPVQIQQVSSYILTLTGITPLNPKEPQGEKYEPAIEQPTDVLTEDELELEAVEEVQ